MPKGMDGNFTLLSKRIRGSPYTVPEMGQESAFSPITPQRGDRICKMQMKNNLIQAKQITFLI